MRRLLDPAHPLAPKYWANETSGRLTVAVMKYLQDDSLTPADIALLRAYLMQWIGSPVWDNPEHGPEAARILNKLRVDARAIRTREQLHTWLRIALEFGVDPL